MLTALVALLAMMPAPRLHADAPLPAHHETWMTVLLNGRKIGHAHFTREVRHDQVVTRQDLHIELSRGDTAMPVESTETDTETLAGKPLSAETVTRLSGQATEVRVVRRSDGRFDVIQTVGGSTTRSVRAAPAGALLAEGQRLAAKHAGMQPGTRYRFVAWDIGSGMGLITDNTVAGKRVLDLPGGRTASVRIDQTATLPVGSIDTTLWVDPSLMPLKLRTSMLGMNLDMLACDKACALAPDQSMDILDRTMVSVPRKLDAAQRRHALRFRFEADDGKPLHVIDTDEQNAVQSDDGAWVVTVSTARRNREQGPRPADTRANTWLQSDDPALRTLTRHTTRGVEGNGKRMQALERFVSGYISSKNLDVGYASAREVLRDRRGDCTEHAVLLAAMARAADIPARVVTGLVYTPRYQGRDSVLVPHAWVQAWVNGHWHSYDAALNGFDTGHIAFDTGNGDPWKFFAGIDALGRIRLTHVQVLPGP